MKNLDLRQVGTIMGLPLYVDVADVFDHRYKGELISAREKKVMMVSALLQRTFTPPPVKEGDDEVDSKGL